MDLTSILNLGLGLIDKLVPDPKAKAEMQLQLLQLQQQGQLDDLNADVQLATNQAGVDKAEASTGSLFIAGWRPFIGWVCGTGLAYDFVVQPLISGVLGPILHTSFAPLDVSTLMTLLFGMLGLSGFRTAERISGVSTKGSKDG